MQLGLEIITNNVGVTFEYIIFIIFIFGSLIFFAQNFKIGLVMLFFGSGLIFMWLYNLSYNYTPFLILMIIGLILMAFSLLGIGKTSAQGGLI